MSKHTPESMLLQMGEVWHCAPDGEEGISYDQAVIHFADGPEDDEREICISAPNAPKIAERIVESFNDRDRLREVNAALLAALKEIEAFTADVGDDDPLSHVCGVARAAIAKTSVLGD